MTRPFWKYCVFLFVFFISSNRIQAQGVGVTVPKSQAYEYEINLTVPKPRTFLFFPFNKLARVKTKVTYPAEWVGTELYINDIEPKADAYEFGPEWAPNQYLTFFLPADKENHIRIKGEALVEALNIDELTPIREAYETTMMDSIHPYRLYMQPSDLIESNHPKIVAAAKKIRGNKMKLKEVVEATYDYVIDKIDYDYLQLEILKDGQFVPSQSAVETLEKGSGICSDYSRLLVALLRAQGIPSRLVSGGIANTNGENVSYHAWVQFLIPNAAFIDIDPTWGENGKRYISDIDTQHIRLHFSTPGNDDIAHFDAYTIDPSYPFWGKWDKFRYYLNFSKIDSLTEQETIDDVLSLAPVFYSEEKGFLPQSTGIDRFNFLSVVVHPLVVLMIQNVLVISILIVVIVRLMRTIRDRKKSKKKRSNRR